MPEAASTAISQVLPLLVPVVTQLRGHDIVPGGAARGKMGERRGERQLGHLPLPSSTTAVKAPRTISSGSL
ncbi:hypothetical protein ACFQ6U_30660 [Streptomyces sp. NPDC056465]|uniref:hypothetical protein n=1 Tax=unclassified Streptomyces TaxID=2593676 RepID=UPI0035E11317